MLRYFSILLLLLLTLPSLQATENLADLRSARADRLIQPEAVDQALLATLVLAETNRYRASYGRAPLEWLDSLGEAARDHATAMTTHGFFAHQNDFDPEQRTLGDRIARVGLQPSASAENIAMTFSVDFHAVRDWMRSGGKNGPRPVVSRHTYRTFAQSLVRQWMDSPGHRANILNPALRYLGVGFSTIQDSRGLQRFYCVQEFCAPPRQVVTLRPHFGLL